MTGSQTHRLVERTARRQWLVALGSHFHLGWLVAAGLILVVICVGRLLAVIPGRFDLTMLWVLPAIAAVIAIALARRPAPQDVARLIDQATGSKELFLTATLIGTASGSFQPIVIDQAESRAGEIDPRRVVPFRWGKPLRDIVLAAAVVATAMLYLPQLDPFKQQAAREKVAQQREKLEELKKTTEVRAAQIAETPTDEKEQVQRALADLENTFREAQPQEREANLQKLTEQQQALGKMWREASQKQRNDAYEKSAQQFGQANLDKVEKWREDLKKGDLSALRKELSDLRSELKKLEEMPEGAEKREMQEQLAQRLNSMADGLKHAANNQQLNAALQRAMQQLDMTKLSELSKEALQAAQESLNLSQQELEQLAQQMKDLQSLEEALKASQAAKQLAQMGKLDGKQCDSCQGMGDYASLYQDLVSKMGLGAQNSGSGAGMQGPGQGQGGKAPENEDAETAFKQEKSPTKLSGGRMLLQWKVNELGPTGERTEQFREAIREVKQGVSEAIIAEQIPPGYHEAVQKYFDALPENVEPAEPPK